MRSRCLLAFALLPAAMAASVLAAPFDGDPALRQLLVRELRFTSSDFNDLTRGRTVRRTVDTSAPGEVFAVGAVRIGVNSATFLEAFRDIASFKGGEQVIQIARFSDPPTPSDLDALTITDEDFDGRQCHLYDCPVRLPAADILRFEREINWGASDARARSAMLFKQLLFDHVTAYWAGGRGRFTQYNDGRRPILPLNEFQGLLAESEGIVGGIPGLVEHLRGFPVAPLEGSEDFLYWSKERFGIAPFITITHVTITHTPGGSTLITSRDVYSSRYLDSSLGVTIVSDAPDDGAYLVYANRSRANALKGGFSALRRAIVERRARNGLEQSLQTVKKKFERRR